MELLLFQPINIIQIVLKMFFFYNTIRTFPNLEFLTWIKNIDQWKTLIIRYYLLSHSTVVKRCKQSKYYTNG